jgi:hypothetical protein
MATGVDYNTHTTNRDSTIQQATWAECTVLHTVCGHSHAVSGAQDVTWTSQASHTLVLSGVRNERVTTTNDDVKPEVCHARTLAAHP